MAKLKLNDRKVKALKPSTKRKEYFDSGCRGLCLRVTSDGTKSWSVFYRQGSRLRRYTLGKYPEITLKDAREKTIDALRDADKGQDPMARKAADRLLGTFGELSDAYMSEYSRVKKKSWPEDRRMLDAYILPELKHLKASAVTLDDVELLLEKVAKRGPIMANRVRALLRHIYSWSVSVRAHRKAFGIATNPCADAVRLGEEKERSRVYSNDELKAIWKACGSDAVGIVGELFKLQLLTATRKGELLTMEWPEVDFDEAVWTQPAEKTKNGKEHVVPLSAAAIRILESLRARQDNLKNKSKQKSKFVFHSSRTGAIAMTWLQKAADRVKTESKVKDFRAHDLRRTAATRLTRDVKVQRHVLTKLLNHSGGQRGGKVTDIYDRYEYFDERKQALDLWASRLTTIVTDLKVAQA